MKLIFCVDDNNGVLLFGKRQSRDSALINRLTALVGDADIWMNEYSAKLFGGHEKVHVDNDYIKKAHENDFCFIENGDYTLDGVDEIFICHWNRSYPADKYFDIDLSANGFQLFCSEDIVGKSHDKITIEKYARVAK